MYDYAASVNTLLSLSWDIHDLEQVLHSTSAFGGTGVRDVSTALASVATDLSAPTDRWDARDIIVIFATGAASSSATAQAQALHALGVSIIVVQIGHTSLNDIANTADYRVNVASFDDSAAPLSLALRRLVQQASQCKGGSLQGDPAQRHLIRFTRLAAQTVQSSISTCVDSYDVSGSTNVFRLDAVSGE